VDALIERLLLLLDPLASSRGIPISREFDRNLLVIDNKDTAVLASAVY